MSSCTTDLAFSSSSKQRETSVLKSDFHLPKLSFTYTIGNCSTFIRSFNFAILRAVSRINGRRSCAPSNFNSLIISMISRQICFGLKLGCMPSCNTMHLILFEKIHGLVLVGTLNHVCKPTRDGYRSRPEH